MIDDLHFLAGKKATIGELQHTIDVLLRSGKQLVFAADRSMALADRGCRFVLQNADAAGPGVFQAAAERGIFAFGSNRAQHEIAPTAVLASAVIDIPGAFLAVAREVKDGTFTARVLERTIADGTISVVYNPALAAKIPDDVRAAVAATESAIRRGTLHVPTAEF